MLIPKLGILSLVVLSMMVSEGLRHSLKIYFLSFFKSRGWVPWLPEVDVVAARLGLVEVFGLGAGGWEDAGFFALSASAFRPRAERAETSRWGFGVDVWPGPGSTRLTNTFSSVGGVWPFGIFLFFLGGLGWSGVLSDLPLMSSNVKAVPSVTWICCT